MGFTNFRVGHAGSLHRPSQKRADPTPNASCSTGGFYVSPSNGATVDSLSPVNITWDPSCLATTSADIYLYSPGSTRSRIHVWEAVPFSGGTYTASLMPRWWNSTATQSLQITIVPAGTPPFLTSLPAGPVFTATYSAPSDGSSPPPEADTSQVDSGITQVNNGALGTTKALSPGKTAAAVLLPLLFVLLLAAAYLKFQRAKGREQRKRWSQAVDKRMSTISADWKSMSAAGANAAIRNSIAVNRGSSAFSFGAIRPTSAMSMAADGGHAGIGAAAGSYNTANRPMAQVRTGTGVGLRGAIPSMGAERVSRVSFAVDSRVSRVSFADTTASRPSGESRRTRAFHSAYVPPLPTRQDVVSAASSMYPSDSASIYPSQSPDYDEGVVSIDSSAPPQAVTLSPKQLQGPLTLTSEDIRARIHGKGHGKASSGDREKDVYGQSYRDQDQDQMDEVLPALSMMRTGHNDQSSAATSNSNDDDLLFAPPTPHMPTPPIPTHAKTISPFVNSPAMFTPSSPSIFGAQQQQFHQHQQAQGSMMAIPASVMSPDEMLRAYAERRAADSPSSFAPPTSFVPSSPGKRGSGSSGKSRKLSFRTSFGGKKATAATGPDKAVISYPMPAAGAGGMRVLYSSPAADAGPAVVGGRAQYAIGEDEGDNEGAYIGTAN